MSSTGMPSRTSMPWTFNTLCSIPNSRTEERLIGLGREGARVENTPRGVVSRYPAVRRRNVQDRGQQHRFRRAKRSSFEWPPVLVYSDHVEQQLESVVHVELLMAVEKSQAVHCRKHHYGKSFHSVKQFHSFEDPPAIVNRRTGPNSPLFVDFSSNSWARASYDPGHPGPFFEAQEARTAGETR